MRPLPWRSRQKAVSECHPAISIPKDEAYLAWSDTYLILVFLRQQMRIYCASHPDNSSLPTATPILLHSQLKRALSSHPLLEKEISEMHQNNVIRTIQLDAVYRGVAYIFTEDYLAALEAVCPPSCSWLDSFVSFLLHHFNGNTVTSDHLHSQGIPSEGIQWLREKEFLTVWNKGEQYILSVPKGAAFGMQLKRGKEEVVKYLTSHRYQSLTLHGFYHQASLKRSSLPLGLIIDDLLYFQAVAVDPSSQRIAVRS